MSTALTSNKIEQREEAQQHGPDAWIDFHEPPVNRLTRSFPHTTEGEPVISGDSGSSNSNDCTYETQETDEIDEAEETDESEEAQEADESQESTDLANREEVRYLGPRLSIRIDEIILKCAVSDGHVNRPLFLLAHEVRSIEEESNGRFSLNANAQVVRRWEAQNHDQLEEGHDYLAEFLDKLSLVRYPKGRALARAVEIARGLVPPKQTTLLSSNVQLLASLCNVLQQQAGDKPFFLDGRSAAIALGKPHETVASWLRGLHHLGVIRRVSKGVRGMASRYLYLDQRGVNTR